MQISVPHISRIISIGSIGFIFGIGCGAFFDDHIMMIWFFGACFVGLMLMFFLHHQMVWCVSIGVLLWMIGAYVVVDVLHDVEAYRNMEGQQVDGTLIVRDVTDKKWNTQITGHVQDTRMSVLWNDIKYPQVTEGDIVTFSCTAKIPASDGTFDYRMYLAMKQIYVVCDDMSYAVTGHHDDLLTVMGTFRAYLEQQIFSLIPAPQSALASGLLLGGDDFLSEDIRAQFSRTGMTHIVAVSGYNVSIIIMVVISVLIYVGLHRRMAMFFAISAIFGFVMLIGFPSSGVRAGIMGVMVLCAATYGRVAQAYGALFFAAAIMLAYNPLLLKYDIGFQLSFLATLGIIFVYPILERLTVRVKNSFGLMEMILLTISAQVFVLPIIAYHFHTISLISIIANVFVLPIIPITMLCVFLLLLVQPLMSIASTILGWCAYMLLSYELFVIDLFAGFPWGSITVDVGGIFWIVLYYGVVGIFCVMINHWFTKYEI